MIMDVLFVDMRCNDKGMSALGPSHGRFVSDTIGFLRCDLSGLERLADLISDHITGS